MGIANITSRQNWYDNVNGSGPFLTNQTDSPGSPGTDGNNASLVLTAGKRYIALLLTHASGGFATVTGLVFDSGGGDEATFNPITGANQSWDGDAPDLKWAGLFEFNCTSTTGGHHFTITLSATVSSVEMMLFEFDGEDDVGTFVQVVKAKGTGTTADPGSFAAFGSTENAMFLFVAWSDNTITIAATEGRTELSEWNDAERFVSAIHYQNPNGGDTTVNATSTSDTWVAIGLEVKAAGAAAGPGSGVQTRPQTRPLLGGYF